MTSRTPCSTSQRASATTSSGVRETYAPAEGGDGAEGAAPVAARRDLERGVRAAVQAAPVGARAAGGREPVGQRGDRAGRGRHAGDGRGARGRTARGRGEREQGAAVAGDVGLVLAAGQDVLEPARDVGVVVEAEDRVRLGQGLGELGAVALGEAADGHDGLRTPLLGQLALRSAACSRVSTESFLAASTKPQVLTMTASAASGSSTRRKPPSSSRAASSSESTSFRAHPRVTRWTAVSGAAGLVTGAGMTLQYDRPGRRAHRARRRARHAGGSCRRVPARWRSLNLVRHISPRSPV